ncbi:integral membrane protein [Aspergillus californicus]
MRLQFWATLLPCAAICFAAVAQAQTESLPSCALQCLTDLLPNSACAADDQNCICTNVDLNEGLNVCVSANCTVKEGLTTLNATETTCGAPIRDQTSLSIVIPAVGICAVLFVVLRVYTRLVIAKLEIGLDDWATILLGCCVVPVNTGSILLGKAGLGKDMWTLEFSSITRILYLFYIQELLYMTCISLTKICFLLFYLRIFPSDRIRRVIKISCAVTGCYWMAFMFAFAFQCSPPSFNWTGWDGEHVGTCVETNTLVVAAAALNIVLDAWVIALPIPRVLNLQASITTKLQVIFMFSVGFLITGVSIYRTIMLKIFATSTNPTWDNAAGGYWSVIEVDVGLFCLCMPAMRSLLGRLFPSVFGSTKGNTSAGNTGSRPKRSRTTDPGPSSSFVQLVEMDGTGSLKSHGDTH